VLASVLGLAISVAACEAPTAPASALKLETERPSYLYDRLLGPPVTVRVINGSRQTVRLSTCLGNLLALPELWTGKTWEPAPFASCLPEQHVARELAPGDTTYAGARAGSLGTFRMRIALLVAPGEERLAPVASNTFTVY
jgi:hypothetical protein